MTGANSMEIGMARRFVSAAGDLEDRVRRAVVEVRNDGGAGAGIVWGGSGSSSPTRTARRAIRACSSCRANERTVRA